MPTYNAEKTIVSSIKSVVAQTFVDWELIIVDDASTDTTLSLATNLACTDTRIKVLHNAKNSGVAKSRNVAILKAQGNWLAFLDSDDIWHKQKLQKQLHFMAENQAKISFTATAFMNGVGRRSSYLLPAKKRVKYKDLLKANIMSCSSVIVCRGLMLQYPFPEGNLHEDYVVWLRILQNVKFAYGLNLPLLLYRVSKGSKSGRRFQSGMMVFRAYCKVGYPMPLAMVLTIRYGVGSVLKWRKVSFPESPKEMEPNRGIT